MSFVVANTALEKKHSTAYALIQLYDKLDQSNVTLGLFIHLSKPFNTVKHETFLSKHEFYGIRGIALQRFKLEAISVHAERNLSKIMAFVHLQETLNVVYHKDKLHPRSTSIFIVYK